MSASGDDSQRWAAQKHLFNSPDYKALGEAVLACDREIAEDEVIMANITGVLPKAPTKRLHFLGQRELLAAMVSASRAAPGAQSVTDARLLALVAEHDPILQYFDRNPIRSAILRPAAAKALAAYREVSLQRFKNPPNSKENVEKNLKSFLHGDMPLACNELEEFKRHLGVQIRLFPGLKVAAKDMVERDVTNGDVKLPASYSKTLDYTKDLVTKPALLLLEPGAYGKGATNSFLLLDRTYAALKPRFSDLFLQLVLNPIKITDRLANRMLAWFGPGGPENVGLAYRIAGTAAAYTETIFATVITSITSAVAAPFILTGATGGIIVGAFVNAVLNALGRKDIVDSTMAPIMARLRTAFRLPFISALGMLDLNLISLLPSTAMLAKSYKDWKHTLGVRNATHDKPATGYWQNLLLLAVLNPVTIDIRIAEYMRTLLGPNTQQDVNGFYIAAVYTYAYARALITTALTTLTSAVAGTFITGLSAVGLLIGAIPSVLAYTFSRQGIYANTFAPLMSNLLTGFRLPFVSVFSMLGLNLMGLAAPLNGLGNLLYKRTNVWPEEKHKLLRDKYPNVKDMPNDPLLRLFRQMYDNAAFKKLDAAVQNAFDKYIVVADAFYAANSGSVDQGKSLYLTSELAQLLAAVKERIEQEGIIAPVGPTGLALKPIFPPNADEQKLLRQIMAAAGVSKTDDEPVVEQQAIERPDVIKVEIVRKHETLPVSINKEGIRQYHLPAVRAGQEHHALPMQSMAALCQHEIDRMFPSQIIGNGLEIRPRRDRLGRLFGTIPHAWDIVDTTQNGTAVATIVVDTVKTGTPPDFAEKSVLSCSLLPRSDPSKGPSAAELVTVFADLVDRIGKSRDVVQTPSAAITSHEALTFDFSQSSEELKQFVENLQKTRRKDALAADALAVTRAAATVQAKDKDELMRILIKVGEDPELVERLTNELDKLIGQYMLETNKMRSKGYSYHNDGHAREMQAEALLAREAALEIFDVEHEHTAVKLYMKLLEAMFAVHDIVQGNSTPVFQDLNEKESAQRFIDDFSIVISGLAAEDESSRGVLNELQSQVKGFAEAVIVKGTFFMFTKNCSEFLVNFLSDRFDATKCSISQALASVYISVADTMHMAFLPTLRESEHTSRALAAQRQYLKENPLMTLFSRVAPASDRASMQRDAFMQLWGQNLRYVLETAKPGVEEPELQVAIQRCREFMVSGMGMSDMPEGQVKVLFEYLIKAMGDELQPGGFVDGIAKTCLQIPEINRKFKEKYKVKFDVIPNPYPQAWSDYLGIARNVLKQVQGKKSASEQRALVEACMQIALLQTGHFLKPPVTVTAEYPLGSKLTGKELKETDIAAANTANRGSGFRLKYDKRKLVIVDDKNGQVAPLAYNADVRGRKLIIDLTNVEGERRKAVMQFFVNMAKAFQTDRAPMQLQITGATSEDNINFETLKKAAGLLKRRLPRGGSLTFGGA